MTIFESIKTLDIDRATQFIYEIGEGEYECVCGFCVFVTLKKCNNKCKEGIKLWLEQDYEKEFG